jgi:hypothetical protein
VSEDGHQGVPLEGVPPKSSSGDGALSATRRRSSRNVANSTVDALAGRLSQSERSSNSSLIIDSLVKSMEESEDVKSVLVEKITSLKAEVTSLRARLGEPEPEPEPEPQTAE